MAEAEGDPLETQYAESPPQFFGGKTTPPKDPKTGRFLPRNAPPATVPEPAPEPVPEPEPTHQHSRHLMQMAVDLGFSEQEIASTPSEALMERVYVANRQAHQEKRDQHRQAAVQSVATPGRGTEAPLPQESYDLPAELEKDLAPEFAAYLRKQAAKLKEADQFKKEFEDYKKREMARSQELTLQRIDDRCAEYPAFFGKGSGLKLNRDSAEMVRRRAVFREVFDDRREGTLDEKINRAIAALAASVPEPQSDKAEKWRNGGLARPTQRHSLPEPPGVNKAREELAAHFNRTGRGPIQDEEDRPKFLGSRG